MYGLEHGKKNKSFQFDLEIEVRKNHKVGKELIESSGKKAVELKNSMRSASKQEAEELNTLVNGYNALNKVINKIVKS